MYVVSMNQILISSLLSTDFMGAAEERLISALQKIDLAARIAFYNFSETVSKKSKS